MGMNAPILCQAIVVYLGYGVSDAPQSYREKVIDNFGLEILEGVLLVLKEVDSMEVDWSDSLTLQGAGEIVRNEMQERHPEFNKEVLDALVWKYTFDWR